MEVKVARSTRKQSLRVLNETNSLAHMRNAHTASDSVALTKLGVLDHDTGMEDIETRGLGGPGKIKLLFLCTGNSCRSQMAEGWAKALKGDELEPYSAGIETHGLNPLAVKVMAEAGVDISDHKSKLVGDLIDVEFDFVVTVCGHAHETCPVFPGPAKVVHIGFDDPPALAAAAESEEEALDHYRRVRDEIKKFVQGLPGGLMSR